MRLAMRKDELRPDEADYTPVACLVCGGPMAMTQHDDHARYSACGWCDESGYMRPDMMKRYASRPRKPFVPKDIDEPSSGVRRKT